MIWILLLFSFLLRLISLNQSLWLDEAISAVKVRQYSFFEIITLFSPTDFHPPFYYLFLDIWTSIFGYSEISIRMPSVLFSFATGYVVYLIAKVIMNTKSIDASPPHEKYAAFATAFFLLNPLIVYYSQEARMYSMVNFFLSLALYGYFLQKYKQRYGLLLFSAGSFFALLTFYGSIFFIAALLFVICFTFRKSALPFFAGTVFAIILLSPLLLQQMQNSQAVLDTVANWDQVLGNVDLKNIFLIPLKFVTGRVSFDPKILYYFLGLFSGAFIYGIALIGLIKNRMLAAIFFLPLILGIIVSFWFPMLQYFRFQYLIIPLSLAMALGVKEIVPMLGKFPSPFMNKNIAHHDSSKYSLIFSHIFPFTIIIIYVSWSLLYLLFPSFHREDWKGLAREVDGSGLTMFAISSKQDPLQYYLHSAQVEDLETISQHDLTDTFIVIPYAVEIHGIDYRSHLGYKPLLEEKTFRGGLKYEVWSGL